MSLVKPLVRSLVQSLVKPLAGFVSGYYAALAAIGEKWPLLRGLIGSKGTPVTVTIASTSIYPDALGIYRKKAINEAAFGAGLYIDPAITNKCTNYNLNPTDTTNITDGTNVTTTVVTPSSYPEKLQGLVDSGDANGNAYSSSNADVVSRNVQVIGSAGSTNDFSLSIFARVTSGTGGGIRLNNPSTPSTAISGTEWALYKLEGVTAGATISFFQIFLDANTTIEWIANQLTETSSAPESLIECSGVAGTQALTNVSVSTTGFPVNNCTYLIYLPRGLKDNGATQYILDSTADSSNWFRLAFLSGSNVVSWSPRKTGASSPVSASYTADGTPLWIMLTSSNTTGKKIALSNGASDTDPSTADLAFHSTMQIGAFNSLIAFMSGQVAYLTRFNEVITDINAAIQASEYGK